MSNPAFEDAYNLLCGERLGSGIHRTVFECRLLPDCVVKVELEENWRYFANVHEMRFWNHYQNVKEVRKWLAPCEYLSPDGRILIQKRVRSVSKNELPVKLPRFLTDLKAENFGFMPDGRLVCCDYAMTITSASTKLRKADW